jgi:ubiquinone/menaquinone biosynthesis C-methylase UbiE
MGRRSVPLSDPRRWVFNRLAGDYVARPAYPDALVDALAALAGGAGARVADLGAGTGHLALPLAARGLSVTALEPARAMLAALQARIGPGLDVVAVHGRAEATGLAAASFDLVLVADAVQWVDAELAGREAARLLAPAGTLAVVEASFARTPFMDGIASLLRRANPKAGPRPAGAARQILAMAAPRVEPSVRAFRQDVPLTETGLRAFLRSLSFAGPALAPAALDDLVSDAVRIARAAGGARLQRDLMLRWAVRRPRAPSRPVRPPASAPALPRGHAPRGRCAAGWARGGERRGRGAPSA